MVSTYETIGEVRKRVREGEINGYERSIIKIVKDYEEKYNDTISYPTLLHNARKQGIVPVYIKGGSSYIIPRFDYTLNVLREFKYIKYKTVGKVVDMEVKSSK